MIQNKLHIKVCGLTSSINYLEICKYPIDMVGFNFYKKSARYVEKNVFPRVNEIKRVGVFVRENIENIKQKRDLFELDFAQLHGDESIADCRSIQSFLPVIKVFRVDDDFEMESTKDFSFCDYFLFDTKVNSFGGSGKKFHWDKLNMYKTSVPFILSGGLGPSDVKSLKKIDHPMLVGLDVNSGFETQAGIKDPKLIKNFVNEIKV